MYDLMPGHVIHSVTSSQCYRPFLLSDGLDWSCSMLRVKTNNTRSAVRERMRSNRVRKLFSVKVLEGKKGKSEHRKATIAALLEAGLCSAVSGLRIKTNLTVLRSDWSD